MDWTSLLKLEANCGALIGMVMMARKLGWETIFCSCTRRSSDAWVMLFTPFTIVWAPELRLRQKNRDAVSER